MTALHPQQPHLPQPLWQMFRCILPFIDRTVLFIFEKQLSLFHRKVPCIGDKYYDRFGYEVSRTADKRR